MITTDVPAWLRRSDQAVTWARTMPPAAPSSSTARQQICRGALRRVPGGHQRPDPSQLPETWTLFPLRECGHPSRPPVGLRIGGSVFSVGRRGQARSVSP